MEGDFGAILTVSDTGAVSGEVIDRMNNEPYAPIRNEGYGAYVGKVRAAYEAWLSEIADACCDRVCFVGDQANRLTGLIRERWGVEPDFPWGDGAYDTAGVFRHGDNQKWFGLIMHIKRLSLLHDGDERTADVLNLKIEPEHMERLTAREGIFPAFHMNHRRWISVLLDDTLSDGEVMELVQKSFSLTRGRTRDRDR